MGRLCPLVLGPLGGLLLLPALLLRLAVPVLVGRQRRLVCLVLCLPQAAALFKSGALAPGGLEQGLVVRGGLLQLGDQPVGGDGAHHVGQQRQALGRGPEQRDRWEVGDLQREDSSARAGRTKCRGLGGGGSLQSLAWSVLASCRASELPRRSPAHVMKRAFTCSTSSGLHSASLQNLSWASWCPGAWR